MIKYTAAAILVLIPLFWGIFMVFILDIIEKAIFRHSSLK